MSNLTDHAPGEPSYLEREVATSALAETMRNRWGVTTTALISAIFGAGGDFAKLTTSERIAIAEACVSRLKRQSRSLRIAGHGPRARFIVMVGRPAVR